MLGHRVPALLLLLAETLLKTCIIAQRRVPEDTHKSNCQTRESYYAEGDLSCTRQTRQKKVSIQDIFFLLILWVQGCYRTVLVEIWFTGLQLSVLRMKDSTTKSPLKLHNGRKQLLDLGLAFRKLPMLISAVNNLADITKESVLGFFSQYASPDWLCCCIVSRATSNFLWAVIEHIRG